MRILVAFIYVDFEAKEDIRDISLFIYIVDAILE